MNFISINHGEESVEFKGDYSSSHPLVYTYFKSLEKSGSYDSRFEQALALGCYAMTTDKIGRVLDKISTDLDGELGELKKLIEIRGMKIITTQKGDEAETDIADVLQRHADANDWSDSIVRTGGQTGSISRSKIGDIVISLEGIDRKIVVESKLDSSVKLGDPGKKLANLEKKTAYGQNAASLANRDAVISIYVGDVNQSDKSISDAGRVVFYPELPAFVVLADAAVGDYSLVEAVYSLSRGLAYAWESGTQKWDVADLIIGRVQDQVNRLVSLQAHIDAIEKSANDILKKVEALKSERDLLGESASKLKDQSKLLRQTPTDSMLKREIYLELSQ